MTFETSAAEQELESLTQFLYIAPIGLVQAAMDGEVLLLNAMSSRLLMPLAPQGDLSNLFDVFEDLAPDLRARVAAFGSASGLICDRLPLRVSSRAPGRAPSQVLSLTLLKLESTRLMAVLDDVSSSLRRDEALRRSQSWITSLLSATEDYAVLPLDQRGRVAGWNAQVGRLTGFQAAASVGAPHSMFFAPGDAASTAPLERARREGWSLDEGWHRRADGSRYWGSSLVVPGATSEAGAASAEVTSSAPVATTPSIDAAPTESTDAAPPEPSAAASTEPAGVAPTEPWPNGPTGTALPESPPAPAPATAAAPAFSLVIRDVSAEHAARESLRRAVDDDCLTGLPNRWAFFEAAERLLQRWMRALPGRPRPLSLLLFGIDRLPAVVERHGPLARDGVLRHLAAQLPAGGVDGAPLQARVGATTFAVLLAHETSAEALGFAQAVCQQVRSVPWVWDGAPVPLSASAGISAMGVDVDSVDVLLERAEAALERARQAGGDRVECAPVDRQDRHSIVAL